MAHEIETMMYTQRTPWHGLGTYVGDQPVLAEEAIAQAGLDWTVDLWPMTAAPPAAPCDLPPVLQSALDYVRIATARRPVAPLGAHDLPYMQELEQRGLVALVDGGAQLTSTPVPDHYAVVRNTDRAVLGCVGAQFTPLQNAAAFRFMDEVAGADRLVRYHTAGSLGGGRRVWLLAELTDLIEPVPGDAVQPYLLLSNSHDGRGVLRVLYTSVRVVCQNTLNLAMNRAGSAEGIAIRHTSGITGRVDEARRVLGLARDTSARATELARALARRPMSRAQFDAFADALIPLPTGDGSRPGRATNTQATLVRLFEQGPGTELPGVAGTRWAALNAITDYTTHHRSTRTRQGEQESAKRLESSWFGSGDALNQRALALLTADL